MASIPAVFDSVCFSCGENDAIIGPEGFIPLCYLELQQASITLACQLHHRFRRPAFVLLDLRGVVAAEAVSMLACMRIRVPFVPISTVEYHSGQRLASIVKSLRSRNPSNTIVAVVRCDNDKDPILSLLASVDIHNVIYVDNSGNLLEPMNVSESLPSHNNDDLYVLFTSGTSGNAPKAVVGSSRSTLHRLEWFAESFPSKEKTIVARRTKLTFVDSITEVFSALLFPPTVLYALDMDTLAEQGVSAILNTPCTRVTMLPSQLSQLLLSHAPENNCLETIIISGEPCPSHILPKFRKHFPTTTLTNLYGQTESTGDVTCAVLTEMEDPVVDNVVAVGRPIPKVSISLSTNNELIVAGNLANGYLHSDTPFASFHTGDVGFSRNGCWYVRGRIDDVAKVNGIMTAPSEVEAVVTEQYKVSCVANIVDGQVYVIVEENIPFSREEMRKAGIPWNLVPKRIFKVHLLPRSGGAGKVDRAAARTMVTDSISKDPESSKTNDTLRMVLQDVLGVPVDEEKSFVEMGGDSALAITLLYRLRGCVQIGVEVTAWHVLEASSIRELRAVLNGERCLKRTKTDFGVPQEVTFATRTVQISERHVAVTFKACVDAAPLGYGTDIYGACQGGIIQRIVNGGEVVSHRDLGWNVQAAMIVADESLIVCGYSMVDDTGVVAAMDLDLSSVKWTRQLNGRIKSTPVQVGPSIYVVAGKRLFILNAQDGSDDDATLKLPSCTESKPAVLSTGDSQKVVFAFSDWDAGLAVVEQGAAKTTILPGVSCPVYADVMAIGEHSVVVGDIQGCVHCVNVINRSERTTSVSNKPIFSGPTMCSNGKIVFGCHDGLVRCIKGSDFTTCWEYDTESVVYAKPLVVGDEAVVVCTTAGDIIKLISGKEVWRIRLNGEIWSDPVKVGSTRIAVGARDSKLHIIEFN